MSKDNTSDDYEVGYKKPPKSNRFQRGASGNPKGRPKKARDFDTELLREANSLITANEGGERKRISKLQGVVIQLTNKAMTGNVQALRIYLGLIQRALEKAAQEAGSQPSDSWKEDDAINLTDEQLLWVARGGLEKMKQKGKKRHASKRK